MDRNDEFRVWMQNQVLISGSDDDLKGRNWKRYERPVGLYGKVTEKSTQYKT